MSSTMTRWVEMTVRFAGNGDERRPVAVMVKRPPSGTRVTVRVDPECLITRSVHLLSRTGTDIVLMAAMTHEQAEAARLALGKSTGAYQVVKVDVVDEAADLLEPAPAA